MLNRIRKICGAQAHGAAPVVSIVLAVLLASSSAQGDVLDPNAFTSLGTLNVTSGTLTINTDSLAISGAATFTGVSSPQEGGPQVAVFDFSSISIGSGVTVNITGSRALAFLSRGTGTIQTTLNVSGTSSSGVSYLGGYQGGLPPTGTFQAGAGPGGGGANAAQVGGGGYGGMGGEPLGGISYGDLFQTLQGGSGGGAVCGSSALGGNGGGAIEIVASGNLTVASVTANGGNAIANNVFTDAACGGAGGGILLSSGSNLSVTSPLSVFGGGCSAVGLNGGGAGGGRIGLAGLSSYTLTTSPFVFNLGGSNGGGPGGLSGSFGLAGAVTVDALTSVVPAGTTTTLTGSLITSVAGSTTRDGFTVDAYVRRNLSVFGTVLLGTNNPLRQLDSSGNNVTVLSVNGTFDLNGFSQVVDTLGGLDPTATVQLGTGSILTVGISNASGGYPGHFNGPGQFVKTGTGTLSLSGTSAGFTGSTLISAGTLAVSNNQALQNSTVTLAGGILSFSVANPGIGALAGSTNLPLAGLTSLTVGGNNSSTTYAGNLSGTISGGLDKAGNGTWTLTGTNTQSGPINIQAGTLFVGSSGALSPNDSINTSAGATLDLNGYNYTISTTNPLVVQGTLRLGGASVTVASGATATANGGTISNGFLFGAGTQTLTGGATLSGMTTSSSMTVSQTGAALVTNFTNNAQFNNAAGQSLNWAGGTNTSAGRLTVGGTVMAVDFVSNGVITINGGGALNNSGANMVLGGGSRTTINSAGVLSAAPATTIELNGGLLINNGTITGTTDVNFGSLAKGTGAYGVVNVSQGGVYAPGNSPGIVTAAAVTFDNSTVSSGAAELQIELGGTTPGTGYDQLHVTGQLSLGGTLQVSLVNNFTPAAETSTSFDILDWGTLVGKFSNLQLPSLNAPLGWDTSQLYTTGVITATAFLPGDINRDGKVTVADISALMGALSDFNNYLSANPDLDSNSQLLHEVVDVNGDGKINNTDLQALITLLANNAASGGGQLTAVPEPATLTLSVIALSILATGRLRRRVIR